MRLVEGLESHDLTRAALAGGRAHDQTYQVTRLPTGKYTFHRRT